MNLPLAAHEQAIFDYLVKRITDPSDFYGSHYTLLKDACAQFDTDFAAVEHLYHLAQAYLDKKDRA